MGSIRGNLMSKDKVLFIFNEKEMTTANAINSGTTSEPNKRGGKETLFGNIEHFEQTKKIQSENLFFLGHTGEQSTISLFDKRNEQTIGGFSTKEFAKSIAHKYPREDRKNLKHVYLIGCEVGFIGDNTRDCLAQKIADELYAQGFQNVTIHAMTNPVDAPKAGMRIRITSKTGVLQAFGREIGDIQALSYNATQIEQEKQEQVDKTLPPYSSIRRTQLIAEWNRPVNTFTPTQLPHSKPTPLKMAAQEKIIYQLDQTIKKLGLEKGKSELIEKLSKLRDGFANSTDYKSFINDEKNRYEKVSKKPKRSSYFNLLIDIQKELNNENNSLKPSMNLNSCFFKPSYQNTTHLFSDLENRTLTNIALKLEAALMNIRNQRTQPNLDISNFIDDNEMATKLLTKVQTLEKEGSDEARLKANSIRLILTESRLMNNFDELVVYLTHIKNANQPTNEVKTPSFYQETLNRPRGIIDKLLQFFGWRIHTETAELFDKFLDAVRYRLEVENRPKI